MGATPLLTAPYPDYRVPWAHDPHFSACRPVSPHWHPPPAASVLHGGLLHVVRQRPHDRTNSRFLSRW
jgi:hypothetical protein